MQKQVDAEVRGTEARTVRNALRGAAPSLEGAPRVLEVNDRAALVALEPEWNALVRETDDQLFYRHEFIRVWIDNFAPEARLRVLVLRGADGRLDAVLPLIEQRTHLFGLPVRQLAAAANVHSCRFDLVARDAEAASRAFLSYLARDPGWDLLRLTDVPEGGKAHTLFARAPEHGLYTGSYVSLRSPYVPLPESWEALQKRVDSKFKANLRRRRKRLEEKGRVTVERVEGGDALARVLEEGLVLEQSGWKGRGGTAIAQNEATRGFYSELARTAVELKALALYFLRLDGRVVGFHYALEYGGRYLLLKPAYDEAIRECSPGQLLMETVLQACIERGLPEFDFLGPDMPWKRDWTDQVRRHEWLFIFRGSPYAKLLRDLKFRFVPAAKEMVKRWMR